MIVFKQESVTWTNDIDTSVEYVVHNDVSLSEMLQHFRKFLLACGYNEECVNERIEAE